MKTICIFIVMVLAGLPALAQTYPASFAWPVGEAKDQKEQGPCHIFAAAAIAESYYQILYSTMPDIAEAHLYSPCAHADVSTSSDKALEFMRDKGVVTGGVPNGGSVGCLPYTSETACNDGGFSDFYHAQISESYLSDCGTPVCDCTGSDPLPDERFRIGDFAELDVTGYSANDLRRAILNYGPITVWFKDATLHPNTNHAYMLYGWTNDYARLKDSWPNAPDANVTSKLLTDIITHLNNPSFLYAAYYIKSTAQNPALYRQARSGSSWVDGTPALNCITGTQGFTIAASPNVTYIANSPVSFSITGPFDLYNSPTVQWAYESLSGNANVSFSPATGTTTSASYGGGSGNGYIVARIKRPNGVCESYRRAVQVSNGIPVTLTKTYDYCPGSYRAIQYTASSTISGLSYSWTFPPPSGTYYTYITNYSTSSNFLVHLYTLPTSYGLLLSVTDPNYPGASYGSTTGGYAPDCGGWFMASDDSEPSEKEFKELSVYPVPSSRELSIDLYDDELYELKLIDKHGKTIFSGYWDKSFKLDVSNLEKGVHLLRLIPRDKSRKTITRRIVVE